jgi:protein-S-isoprenylcysteine O-methyltransferase Ste14
MGALDKGALSVARLVWDTVAMVVLCSGWALVLSGVAFVYAGWVNSVGLFAMLVGAAFLIWQSGRLRRRSLKWVTTESQE